MKLLLSDPAKEDLLEIWRYIAQDNSDAATNLMHIFREKFDLLTNFPTIGRECNDFAIGLRSFPIGSYLIFYKSAENVLEIVRVRHGATNLEALFDE